MRKLKFFESKQHAEGDDGASQMDFSNEAHRKGLNDIIVYRMLYLDYFFLFMG